MSAILVAGIWALVANLVAMLPHNRLHFTLGGVLLLCFPVVLWMIGQAFGGWAVFAVVLVGVSLFRLPLVYYIKKALGKHEPD
ncbi:MAG: DUF2484 family protein [Rhodobacteraceae bacterium]|nr:DUF2484 family protein [Paracoccaceae bacterium]